MWIHEWNSTVYPLRIDSHQQHCTPLLCSNFENTCRSDYWHVSYNQCIKSSILPHVPEYKNVGSSPKNVCRPSARLTNSVLLTKSFEWHCRVRKMIFSNLSIGYKIERIVRESVQHRRWEFKRFFQESNISSHSLSLFTNSFHTEILSANSALLKILLTFTM